MSILKAHILFPSSSPKSEARVQLAKAAVAQWSHVLECVHPRTVPPRRHEDCNDYLAGTDRQRCCEVADFLLSSTQEIGWFGRGGYGATRILPDLQKALQGRPLGAPKRWLGYSDISALFAFVKSQNLSVECIHGPMLCAFHEQPNQADITEALAGRAGPIEVSDPHQDGFSGTIWGGNLAVIASLAGTPWLPKLQSEEAFFFEDIDEAPYRIDRYLPQLSQAGFFDHCRQVFLGTFTQFHPESAVLQRATELCQDLGLKILGRLPVGHSEPHTPLFLDRPYRLAPESSKLLPV